MRTYHIPVHLHLRRTADVKRQLTRFIIVGALGFLVDAGMLWLTLQAGIDHFVGRVISFTSAALVTWQFNRRVTFLPRQTDTSVWHEWWRYFAAMSVGGSVNFAVYAMIVLSLPQRTQAPFIGIAAGSLAGLFVNFAAARWWVFHQKKK